MARGCSSECAKLICGWHFSPKIGELAEVAHHFLGKIGMPDQVLTGAELSREAHAKPEAPELHCRMNPGPGVVNICVAMQKSEGA